MSRDCIPGNRLALGRGNRDLLSMLRVTVLREYHATSAAKLGTRGPLLQAKRPPGALRCTMVIRRLSSTERESPCIVLVVHEVQPSSMLFA
jgi:hypothetical protein